jgi:hypothetical protein
VKVKPIKLVDAQAMARAHPYSYEAPSRSALSKLRFGDVVKVCDNRERFWVQIEKRKGDVFIGRVDNMLLFADVSYNDRIEFHADNIYEIHEGERG